MGGKVSALIWRTPEVKYCNNQRVGLWARFNRVRVILVRDSSAVRRHYIFLLEPWDVKELYIRKTVDLLLQLWVSTFPRFVAIGFYILSETLI
jgi:hypothetical protein